MVAISLRIIVSLQSSETICLPKTERYLYKSRAFYELLFFINALPFYGSRVVRIDTQVFRIKT